MKNNLRHLLLCCALLLCSLTKLSAQDSIPQPVKQTVVIETKDGATLTGTLIKENADTVVVLSPTLGQLTIARSQIRSIKVLEQSSFVKGEYWFENPNATRYVIGPSAIPLKKREGYYQNLYVFVQSFNVGITDHISIGAGTEIASLIFGQEPPAFFFITPKYGTKVAPKVHVGGGVLYIGLPNSFFGSGNGMNHYGIAYGLVTLGNLNNNFTLGLGWNFSSVSRSYYQGSGNYTYERENEFATAPTITLSGMVRPTKRFGLVTENWIYPLKRYQYSSSYNQPPTYTVSYDYEFYFSYGCRFMGEKIAIDVGFINSPDLVEYLFVGIPYIDFVVKFGGNDKSKRKSAKK